MPQPTGEWVDARELLEAAIAGLKPGEMVKAEDTNLTQLMSAIEVMDPRTDSYLSAQANQAGPSLFEPTRDLLPTELLWVLDELLRLEVSHLDGHPIGSTLWASLCLRAPALAALQQAHDESTHPHSDYRLILRAMLLGILKCAECTWQEYCAGQVYEHEDVHLSLSSLSFSALQAAAFHPPLPEGYPTPAAGQEEPVSVDDCLHLLDLAMRWLQVRVDQRAPDVDLAVEEALLGRVKLRIDLLYAQAVLSSPPHTSPDVVLPPLLRMKAAIPLLSAATNSPSPLPNTFASPPNHHLKTAAPAPVDATATLASPSSTPASTLPPPPDYLAAVFSPAAAAALASNSPPRAVEPFTLADSWTRLAELVNDLISGVKGWENWQGPMKDGRGGAWKEAKEYSLAMGRKGMGPYAMSVHQTILCSSSVVFGNGSVLTLTSSFFEATTGLPETVWGMLRLLAEREDRFDAPARTVVGWAEKVGRLLVEDLARGSQNRARQRRNTVKSKARLDGFVEDATKLVPTLTNLLGPTCASAVALLPLALRALQLSQQLEALLSGFELNLFEPSEHAAAYFVAAQCSRAAATAWGTLAVKAGGAGAVGYRLAKRQEATALEGLSWAAMRAALLFPPKKVQLASLLPSLGLKDEARVGLEKARWEQRFGWLLEEVKADWGLFEGERRRVQGLAKGDVAREASLASDEAVEAVGSCLRIPFGERGGQGAGRPELALKWLAALRRTAVANSAAFGKLAEADASAFPATCEAVWDHVWFATWKA